MAILKVLLVEDTLDDAEAMETYFASLPDMELIATTGSAVLALATALKEHPDAIILNIELEGSEDGLSVLEGLRAFRKEYAPFIIVTSVVETASIKKKSYFLGAQFFCRKSLPDYSPAFVVGKMRGLLPFWTPEEDGGTLRPLVIDERLFRSETEFRLAHMHMDGGLCGHRYIVEELLLIFRAVLEEREPPNAAEMAAALGAKYNKTSDSISKAVQYALDQAWASCPPEILKEEYPFEILSSRNSPPAKEFVFNFFTIIKKRLLNTCCVTT